MKYLFIIPICACSIGYGQLSIDTARLVAGSYKMGIYDYHEQFIGHVGYGAPIILTNDGGAAFFGDHEDEEGEYGLLIIVDNNGDEIWKKAIRPQFDDIESQSVIEDRDGNFYVFMLSYDNSKYRGGSERIVCLDNKGEILWDHTIGDYGLVNNPIIAYIRLLDDGRIALRGHVVSDKPEKGEDPLYRYWEGWINNKGELNKLAGDVIDWSNPDCEKRYRPE